MTFGLEKCDGIECPYCGCRDTEIDRTRGRWGGETVKHRCNNCGAVWYPRRWTKATDNGNGHQTPATSGEPLPTPDDDEQIQEISPGGAVIYRPVQCPECGSTETAVTSTRRPVRYHKCKACGHSFKSVEHSG